MLDKLAHGRSKSTHRKSSCTKPRHSNVVQHTRTKLLNDNENAAGKQIFLTARDNEGMNSMNRLLPAIDNALVNFDLDKNLQVTEGIKQLSKINRGKSVVKRSEGSIRDFVESSRGILLARIGINKRRAETERMKKYILEKEKVLELNKELCKQDMQIMNKYIDLVNAEVYNKKKEANNKIKERRAKEFELAEILQQRARLNQQLAKKEEKYLACKPYKDFLLSFTKPEKTAFFITEDAIPNTEECDEHFSDLDKEAWPEFPSTKEFLELMDKKERENEMLFNNMQYHNKCLKRQRKKYNAYIKEKERTLQAIKEEAKTLHREEKLKMKVVSELTERIKATRLNLPSIKVTDKEQPMLSKNVKHIKGLIRIYVADINSIFDKTSQNSKGVLTGLRSITDNLLKLKMIRSWKYLAKNREDLVKQELAECDRIKRMKEKKKRAKSVELANKKLEELKLKLALQRKPKFGKIIMRKSLLKSSINVKRESDMKDAEDEFDDKYFID
eukprot:TRINITY_DN8062_c0_g1_i3.p1 TRINITY_DN8062_c0_g1~~TRINITY_DN8062_c0_g1_i3.p1  ORF type:complete len:502 (-),score=81.55 TRINITY_DN8062_c0_g1_i3:78-1583(-)